MTRPGRRSPALPVLLLSALSACGTDEQAAAPACPQVFLVADAERLVEPAGSRDAVPVAEIVDVAWTCEVPGIGTSGVVELSVFIRVAAGATADGERRVPFFAALTDPSGTIVAKRVFETDLVPEDEATPVEQVETVSLRWRHADLDEALAHTVFVGLQLTPEQLAAAR